MKHFQKLPKEWGNAEFTWILKNSNVILKTTNTISTNISIMSLVLSLLSSGRHMISYRGSAYLTIALNHTSLTDIEYYMSTISSTIFHLSYL